MEELEPGPEPGPPLSWELRLLLWSRLPKLLRLPKLVVLLSDFLLCCWPEDFLPPLAIHVDFGFCVSLVFEWWQA